MHGSPFFAFLKFLFKLCGYRKGIRVCQDNSVEGGTAVVDCLYTVKIGLHNIGNGEIAIVIALLKLGNSKFFETEFGSHTFIHRFLIACKERY